MPATTEVNAKAVSLETLALKPLVKGLKDVQKSLVLARRLEETGIEHAEQLVDQFEEAYATLSVIAAALQGAANDDGEVPFVL